MKFDDLIESMTNGDVLTNSPLYNTDKRNDCVFWKREGGNLEGAPQTVDGSFFCSCTSITSLVGGPEIVNGSFTCHTNRLKSLEGAPEKVGGRFDCRRNPLTSLKGIPEAASYDLPDEFTEEDALKEVERRKFRKGLDKDTEETWGDFVDQL